jgi:predicted metal-dependent enzyme (double-stranded beta helix superfamily)
LRYFAKLYGNFFYKQTGINELSKNANSPSTLLTKKLAMTLILDAVDIESPLTQLAHSLDVACCLDPASPGFTLGVRAALAGLSGHAELLSKAQRESSPNGYTRHLLFADPLGRYAVAALVWRAGQMSPIHGHHTWCAYRVIEGALTETLFSWDTVTNRAIETRRHERVRGAVSVVGAGRGAIHRLENAPAATGTAVSIHVYGVTGAQISTHVNDLVHAA